MCTSYHKRNNVIDTIEGWRLVAFKNPILNQIWHLLPGFILWKIWKEPNQRIFHSAQLPWGGIWASTKRSIEETIKISKWIVEDGSCDPNEWPIFLDWDLYFLQLHKCPIVILGSILVLVGGLSPLSGFIKLNFDGASKGNPGPLSFSAIFRNDQGYILHIIVVGIGHDTNNTPNLWDLIRGLHVALV